MDVYCQNIFLCKPAAATFAGLVIEDSGMAEVIFNAFRHHMVFSLLTSFYKVVGFLTIFLK